MYIETERKFLVRKDLWYAVKKNPGQYLRQAYLYSGKDKTIRLRQIGDQYIMTVKGPATGISRQEIEFSVPSEQAVELLMLSGNAVEKIRYKLEYDGKIWDVDEFLGDNEGLILAEIEMAYETEKISFPPWLGSEVTGDQKYFNSYLAEHPFRNWK
ncbi:MAG: CYTH domain-containing protein [Bacteroidota bacterium]|nr:CYTH domain-containing protein [Bacteroidota bacterium]